MRDAARRKGAPVRWSMFTVSRAERIGGLIAAQPRTAHEIAQELWGNVAVTQAYLTLSEVLGHLDLLLRDGTVVEQEREGVVRFQAA